MDLGNDRTEAKAFSSIVSKASTSDEELGLFFLVPRMMNEWTIRFNVRISVYNRLLKITGGAT